MPISPNNCLSNQLTECFQQNKRLQFSASTNYQITTVQYNAMTIRPFFIFKKEQTRNYYHIAYIS